MFSFRRLKYSWFLAILQFNMCWFILSGWLMNRIYVPWMWVMLNMADTERCGRKRTYWLFAPRFTQDIGCACGMLWGIPWKIHTWNCRNIFTNIDCLSETTAAPICAMMWKTKANQWRVSRKRSIRRNCSMAWRPPRTIFCVVGFVWKLFANSATAPFLP